MPAFDVDVIVPVHSATRPVLRAVESVLDHTTADVHVIVVAHNIDPSVIRANLGDAADDPRVRLVSHQDGIQSPAGPMNRGLDESTAPFYSLLGSDDEFEPGALDSWLETQRRTNADVVIARIHHAGAANDATPAARFPLRDTLDPVRDRLAYRSSPLGLISREEFGRLRFPEGIPSGEDLPFVMQLWFSGGTAAMDHYGPAYLGHHDAADRVSFTPRPMEEDFRFLDYIYDAPWYQRLGRREKQAIAIKLLRSQVLDAIVNRKDLQPWPATERDSLASIVRRIRNAAPGVEKLLARADRDVIEAVLEPGWSMESVILKLDGRWNLTHLPAVLPRNPFLAAHNQGPFRSLLGALRTGAKVPRQRRQSRP